MLYERLGVELLRDGVLYERDVVELLLLWLVPIERCGVDTDLLELLLETELDGLSVLRVSVARRMSLF